MSSYFRALFTGGMQESHQKSVLLHDTEPELCEKMLRMLYGQPLDVTEANLLTFVHLSDYYGVDQLSHRTDALLEELVTVPAANCCAKLVEASALRCDRAQRHCRSVLLFDFVASTRQPAFLTLGVADLYDILGHDELTCESEDVAIDGLLRWWSAQHPVLPQATLDGLLPLMRWPLLSVANLTRVQERHPQLASSTSLPQLLIEAYKFHLADPAAKQQARPCSLRSHCVTTAQAQPVCLTDHALA